MKERYTLPDLLPPTLSRQLPAIFQDLRVVLLSCLFWRMDTKSIMVPRTLHDTLIYLPVRGRMRLFYAEVQHVVAPGQILLIPEGRQHSAANDDPDTTFEAVALHGHFEWGGGLLHPPEFPLRTFNLPHPDFWREALLRLVYAFNNAEIAGRPYGEMLLKVLLLELVATGQLSLPRAAGFEPRVTRALQIIHSQCHKPSFNIAGLSRQVNLGPARFRTLFQENVGVAPKKYLLRHRLKIVSRLLLTTGQSLKEIAELSGFRDASYLSHCFSRHNARPPGDYRRKFGQGA